MTPLEHDSADSLEVSRRAPAGGFGGLGWYVARTCPCHKGEIVTMRFETREQAEHALAVLHEDAHRSQVLRETA